MQHVDGDVAPDSASAAEHTHKPSRLASHADAVVSCNVAMGTSADEIALIGDQKRYNPLKVLKHKVTRTQTAHA